MNEELKPCVFCNGIVDVWKLGSLGNPPVYKIMCRKNQWISSLYYETKQEAIEAWNRRA